MDTIPLGLANGIGVVAVVLIFGGGIFRALQNGMLVTRREVDAMRAEHERQLEDISHDRDEWRAAHRISETARVEEREHNAALVQDIANPVKEFLVAFRQAAATRREETD